MKQSIIIPFLFIACQLIVTINGKCHPKEDDIQLSLCWWLINCYYSTTVPTTLSIRMGRVWSFLLQIYPITTGNIFKSNWILFNILGTTGVSKLFGWTFVHCSLPSWQWSTTFTVVDIGEGRRAKQLEMGWWQDIRVQHPWLVAKNWPSPSRNERFIAVSDIELWINVWIK